MKAFVVSDEYGDNGAVVRFALHHVVARREGACELACEFEDVTCRRAPHFDQYADQGRVPPQALLDAGWWMGCRHCGHQVILDGDDSEGNPLDPVVEESTVFCNPEHRTAYHREKEESRLRDANARAQVVERFPGCGIRYVMPDCYHPVRRDELVARVTFDFPGGQHPADWYVGDDIVSVVREDENAWKAYRKQVREVASHG